MTTQTTLTISQLRTIQDACGVATRSLAEQAYTLNQIASQLRDGFMVPPFADGEAGAIAATALADDKAVRIEEFNDVLDAIADILDEDF